MRKKAEKEAEAKKKEEEKQRAEEARQKFEEAEAEKKKRAAEAFKGFFVKKDALKVIWLDALKTLVFVSLCIIYIIHLFPRSPSLPPSHPSLYKLCPSVKLVAFVRILRSFYLYLLFRRKWLRKRRWRRRWVASPPPLIPSRSRRT